MLDGAALAGVGPVAAQDQSVFLGRVVIGELLTGRTGTCFTVFSDARTKRE